MLSPMSTYNSSSSSSSRCNKPMTSSLSLDLLRNVLSRLPTVSLFKLRSVCREWHDVIDDPHFAAMHATSSIESPRILLLLEPSRSADRRFAVDDELLVTSLSKFSARSWVHVAGASCHGLLCFRDFRDGATYLLNPLSQEILLLPSVDPFHERGLTHSIGIGVDGLTSRYKILRVSYCIDHTDALRAKVLDQGSLSWRDIASAPPSLILTSPVFAAGSIHWQANVRGGVTRISSFDMAKEEFAWTPCPELQDAHLVDLQGVLGLVDCSCEESMDVWVMEQSGQWMKEYRVRLIPPLPAAIRCHLTVLGCGGRKIAFNYFNSLWFYDPSTDELKHEQRPDARRAKFVGSITVSLLSPAKLWNGGVAEISPDKKLAKGKTHHRARRTRKFLFFRSVQRRIIACFH